MRKLQLYIETSVWSAACEPEREERHEITKQLLLEVGQREVEGYISPAVVLEMGRMPKAKGVLADKEMEAAKPKFLEFEEEIERMAQKYVEEAALPPGSMFDALHIAYATYYELDAIVSWNFRHIVKLRRQEAVQAINKKEGYRKELLLVSPQMVSDYGI